MKADKRLAAVVLALMALGNGAFALAVPELLHELTPAMPLGYRESTSPTTEAGATFVDVAAEAGIAFRRFHWDAGDLPYAAVVGGGVAAADVDGDGWEDLYFTAGGPGLSAKLFRNLGAWRFEDATGRAGLVREGFGTGAAFGDYDNDGDADLFTFVEDRGFLYANDGHGAFAERAAAAGVDMVGLCGERPCQGSSVAWWDHDRDGLLDLYVVNNLDWRRPGLHSSGQDYSSLIYFASQQFSVLYRNLGDGTFEDVTDLAGVENTGKGLGVAVADVDGNGWPDLLTANDISENALYLGNGDGTFRNAARAAGANEVKTSMGIAAQDLDGDLRADIAVSNFRGHKLSLLLQQPGGAFAYATDDRGLGASWRGTGWGVAAFDYDLDGWLDLAHAVGRAVPLAPHEFDLNNVVFRELLEDREDQLFRNLGHGYFAEATYSAGGFAGNTTTRALLAIDLDHDGDEDVVRVNLQGEPAEVLRNDRANAHHWLQLDLEGARSNRDGYGARVRVALPDGLVMVRELSSAYGYQTGAPALLTIGLGRNPEAHVTLTWPSGAVQDLGQLAADERYLVREGAGVAPVA